MINLSAVVADLRAERERAQKTVERLTRRSPHSTVSVTRDPEHFGGGPTDEEPCLPPRESASPQHSVLAG